MKVFKLLGPIFILLLRSTQLFAQFSLPLTIENGQLGYHPLVQAADMDNDGIQDIIMVSHREILIIRNQENAFFNDLYRTEIGLEEDFPTKMLLNIADMNGDGFKDIVLAKTFYYYENNSGGRQAACIGLPPPPPPYSSSKIYVYLNNDLDFSENKMLTKNLGDVSDIQCLNILGDQDLEILVSTNSLVGQTFEGDFLSFIYDTSVVDKVCCFYNNQFLDDSFSDELIMTNGFTRVNNFQTFDFDNNGLTDILYSDRDEERLMWISQSSLDSFLEPEELFQNDSSISHVIAEDVNGDDVNDIIYLKSLDVYGQLHSVYVRLTNWMGNYTFPQLVSESLYIKDTEHVKLSDIDNDGDLDFLFTQPNNIAHKASLNNGAGSFEGPEEFVKPWETSFFPFYSNENDLVDLCMYDSYTAYIISDPLQGEQNNARLIKPLHFPNLNTAVPFDYNRDGLVDVVASTDSDNSLIWIENLGESNFSDYELIDDSLNTGVHSNSTFLQVLDFDDDGIDDLITISQNIRTIKFFKSLEEGGLEQVLHIDSLLGSFDSFYHLDLDQDGFKDLMFCTKYSSSKIIVFWNEGALNYTIEKYDVEGSSLVEYVYNDWDNDGLFDFILKNPDDIKWYKNLGNRQFDTLGVIISDTLSRMHKIISDFNGDGVNDLFFETREEIDDIYHYKLLCYINEEGNNYSVATLKEYDGYSMSSIDFLDINFDSQPDLLFRKNTGSTVSYSFLNGDYYLDDIELQEGVDGNIPFSVADFNGDLKPDVITNKEESFSIRYNLFPNIVTDLDAEVNSTKYSLYPNPVINNLMINAPKEAIIIDANLFTIEGKEVGIDFNSFTNTINLDHSLNAGLYFIRIIDKNGVTVLPAIKQ